MSRAITLPFTRRAVDRLWRRVYHYGGYIEDARHLNIDEGSITDMMDNASIMLCDDYLKAKILYEYYKDLEYPIGVPSACALLFDPHIDGGLWCVATNARKFIITKAAIKKDART